MKKADEDAAIKITAAAGKAPVGGASAAPRGGRDVPLPVRLYAPMILLHPSERYMPGDAEEFFRRSTLQKGLFGGDRWLDAPDDEEFRQGLGPTAPAYYDYQRPSGGKDGYVDYWLFYPYNDFREGEDNLALKVWQADPSTPDAWDGVHEGDWERVRVWLDKDAIPSHVTYWTHEEVGSLPWSQVSKDQGHPVAWSALGSHGSYPRAGSYETASGPLNDLAGGKKGEVPTRWDTERRLVDINKVPGASLRWGADEDSPGGPLRRGEVDERVKNSRPDEPADTVH